MGLAGGLRRSVVKFACTLMSCGSLVGASGCGGKKASKQAGVGGADLENSTCSKNCCLYNWTDDFFLASSSADFFFR